MNKIRCACGCGQLIVLKSHHKYYGIPLYLKGNNARMSMLKLWKTVEYRGSQIKAMWSLGVKAQRVAAMRVTFATSAHKARKVLCMNRPGVKAKLSKAGKRVWQNSVYRAMQSKSHMLSSKKMWQDPVIAKAIARSWGRKPTRPENIVDKLLNALFPGEYKYVGAGDFFLGGKCPDFVNVNGQKKVIEVFGDWWHSEGKTGRTQKQEEQSRIRHFIKYGYQTLIIWEKDLKDLFLVEKELLVFVGKPGGVCG